MKIIPAFIMSFLFMTALDIAWIGYLMKSFYTSQMNSVINLKFSLFPAMLFYFLYILGIFVFVIYPNLNSNASVFNVFIYGGLFGFFCYITYDLTNMATIQNWPVKLTLIDIVWGTFITGATATFAYYMLSVFK